MFRRNSNQLYKLIVNHVKNKKGIKTFARLDSSFPKLQYDSTFQAPPTSNFINAFDSLKNLSIPQENSQTNKDWSDGNLEKRFYDLDVHVKKYGRVSKEQIADIVNIIKYRNVMTPVQLLLLIRCCGNFLVCESLGERNIILSQILNLSAKLKIKHDISHLNSLLKVYLENQYYIDLKNMNILKESDEAAIVEALKTLFYPRAIDIDGTLKPSRITYQRLVSLIAESGDISKAESLLEYMKLNELPINENVFASLIVAYGKVNDIENAKNMISIMKQLGLEPNSTIYANLCEAHLNNGSLEEIDFILKGAQENGVMLANKDLLNILFHAITKPNAKLLEAGGWEKVAGTLIPYLKPHLDFMQNLINTTYRVISFGSHDMDAYKLLKYYTHTVGQSIDPLFKFSNQLQNSGSFMLKLLQTQTNPSHSLNELFEIVTDMHNSGLNLYAAQKCLENYFTANDEPFNKQYKRYFNLLVKLQLPIRPHYLWPILAKLHSVDVTPKNQNLVLDHLFDVLNSAKKTYGIAPTVQTLTDYTYPTIEKCLTKLQNQQKNDEHQVNLAGSKAKTLTMNEELSEAMDEDYEDGKEQTSNLPQENKLKLASINAGDLLNGIWDTYLSGYDYRDPKHDALALNSLLFYALNSSSLLKHGLGLVQCNEFIQKSCDNEKLEIKTTEINPLPIYNNMSTLYTTSISNLLNFEEKASTDNLEQTLGQLLAKLNANIAEISEDHEHEGETQSEGHKPQNFDWNGKVLVDILNRLGRVPLDLSATDFSTTTSAANNERIVRLVKAYIDFKLPISATSHSVLASHPLITSNTQALELIKDLTIGTNVSMDRQLITQFMTDLANSRGSTNASQSSQLGNTNFVNYRDASIEKLERLYHNIMDSHNRDQLAHSATESSDPQAENANAINSSMYTAPIKVKSIIRHLLAKYCKEKDNIKYDERIRTLSDQMLILDRITPQVLLNMEDNSFQGLSASTTHLSLVNLNDGTINSTPVANFIVSVYTLLVDYFARKGDGDAALKFKRARELVFPPYKMSVPRILELCTALTGQMVASTEASTPSTSKLNINTRLDQILDLLQEATLMPLSPLHNTKYFEQHDNQSQNNIAGTATNLGTTPDDDGSKQPTSSKTSSAGDTKPSRGNVLSPRSNTEYQAWKMLNLASGGTIENFPYLSKEKAKVLKDFDKIYDATMNLLNLVLGKANPAVGTLGTLINARLNSGDLMGALSEFHRCALEFRLTPQMTVLMSKLIELNDTQNLQKLVDVSSEIHGEQNVLIDLLFSFINLGRFKEANKVLETPNMQYRHSRFEFYCAKLLRENKVKELEYLASATKNLRDVDRDFIFYYLLKAYDKNNDKEGALQLWESWLDDEDTNYHLFSVNAGIAPPQNLESKYVSPDVNYKYRINDSKIRNLILLAQILKRNNVDGTYMEDVELPFTIPAPFNQALTSNNTTTNNAHLSDNGLDMLNQDFEKDKEIVRVLNEGNLKRAIQLKNELLSSGKVLSPRTFAILLEHIVQHDDLIQEALQVGSEMTQKNLFVPIPAIKAILSKLSLQGLPHEIEQRIPEFVNNQVILTKLNVPKYVSYAYTNSGKFAEYLKSFEDKLQEHQQPIDGTSLSLPQGIIYALSKHPEYYDQVEKLADKYAETANNYQIYSLLFTHRVMMGNYDLAKGLYETKLKPVMLTQESFYSSADSNSQTEAQTQQGNVPNIPRVFFNIITICKNAKSTNDETPLKFMINDIGLNGEKQQLGLAYSYWISLKCHNAQYDDAEALYKQAVTNHQLGPEHFKIFALRELKNCLLAVNKPVPFDLGKINFKSAPQEPEIVEMAA